MDASAPLYIGVYKSWRKTNNTHPFLICTKLTHTICCRLTAVDIGGLWEMRPSGSSEKNVFIVPLVYGILLYNALNLFFFSF
ncbi:hypothetical protein GDO78_019651 [Eleutherodactylus coqui]|uniref:Uncharacterized protein n=1 Tax=Eleutherodactylus coqui TaxID=57060 RepID=A0A8J6BE32_ELECQ|nr:hypothetical protein GDO78_019651 [Eleutherodactylus coqui]